jgi:hypothetical protein
VKVSEEEKIYEESSPEPMITYLPVIESAVEEFHFPELSRLGTARSEPKDLKDSREVERDKEVESLQTILDTMDEPIKLSLAAPDESKRGYELQHLNISPHLMSKSGLPMRFSSLN